MTPVRLALITGVAVVLLAATVAVAVAPPESAQQRVERIASEIRCPVCQALSVRDSVSETARAMREVIARRVAEGATDEQIRDEFRGAYGDWILLSPPLDARGVLWAVPPALVVAGLLLASRWLRRRTVAEGPVAEGPGERLLRLRRLVAEQRDD